MFKDINGLNDVEVLKVWKDLKSITSRKKSKKSKIKNVKELITYSQNMQTLFKKTNPKNPFQMKERVISKRLNNEDLNLIHSNIRSSLKNASSIDKKRDKLDIVFNNIQLIDDFLK